MHDMFGHLDHNDSCNFTSYIAITICLLRSQQNLAKYHAHNAHLNHNVINSLHLTTDI